ncbi:MAG: archaellin/type IV pilin N-terminal domain-containing protein [Thermoplasmata archaeon]
MQARFGLRSVLGGRSGLRRPFRRSRRGVSPIIGTILLVAITVALAVVLYVILIPLLPHPSSPLAGNLAWGTANCFGPGCQPGPNSTGCAANDVCWSVTIASANGGVTPSSLQLYVQNGQQQTVSTANWTFSFVTDTNPAQLVSYAHGSIAGSSGAGWIGGPNYTPGDALTLTMTLWIDTGSSHSVVGQSLSLVTVGQNGFSGSIPGLLLPTS